MNDSRQGMLINLVARYIKLEVHKEIRCGNLIVFIIAMSLLTIYFSVFAIQEVRQRWQKLVVHEDVAQDFNKLKQQTNLTTSDLLKESLIYAKRAYSKEMVKNGR
jgi:hypothetical protein